MRLFVGISLAPETRNALEGFVSRIHKEAPGLRWSLPAQWHVTLQFLGETQEAQYSCIVRQLRAIRARAATITLAEPGFFERAKVFHIEVDRSKTLLALQDQTVKALLPCGFEPEARPYTPHITLARHKSGSLATEFKQLQQMIALQSSTAFPSFTAAEFLLYQSITEQSGSRYEVRERFLLM